MNGLISQRRDWLTSLRAWMRVVSADKDFKGLRRSRDRADEGAGAIPVASRVRRHRNVSAQHPRGGSDSKPGTRGFGLRNRTGRAGEQDGDEES